MSYLSFVDLLRTAILVTLLLTFKFVLTTAYWGSTKGKAGLRAPEDRRQNPNPPTPQQLAAADRAGRVVFNDLENLPLGLLMMWGSALCIGASTVPGNAQGSVVDQETLDLIRGHITFSILFCVARFGHTAIYSLAGVTVARSICYALGLASVFSLGIIGAVSVFRVEVQNNF